MNDLQEKLVKLKEKAADLAAQIDELLRLREKVRKAAGLASKLPQRRIFSGLDTIGRAMSDTVH